MFLNAKPGQTSIWLASEASFLRQVFSSNLFRVFFGVPYFFILTFFLMALGLSGGALAADDVVTRQIMGGDFQSTHEALIEVIEAEGLVVSAVIPFNRMLERTAADLDYSTSPFANAETVQFCSSALAWQMITEDPSQLAMCPLSVVVYSVRAESGKVILAYRTPGRTTPGRIKADDLLRRLVERAAELARLKW
jgi:uncharacterized protein (DUF302 family)